jgi:hypothetical protein
MASWRERHKWRTEFRSLGTRQVEDRERQSIWQEEKAQAARRWLDGRKRRPYIIGGLATIIAAILAALIAHYK